VEDRSTVEDRRPRNSYHRVYNLFAAHVASACYWRATDVRAPQSWTPLADALAASAAAITLVIVVVERSVLTEIKEDVMLCYGVIWSQWRGRLWPGGRQCSAPTGSDEVVRLWCRTAVT